MINIYDFITSNSDHFKQIKFDGDSKIFIDYRCPIEAESARVWTHKNCILYVLKGSKGYASSGFLHTSKANQLLFIRKGGYVLHQHFEEPYRALIFMFDDAAAKEFMAEYPGLLSAHRSSLTDFSHQPVVTALNVSSFVESVFMSSLNYLESPSGESRISLGIKFKELFVNLLRDKSSNAFNRYLSHICNENTAAFIKLIIENSHYNFSINELARIACMSMSTFKREFIKHFGVTPGRWLREQRISMAIALLSTTDKNISEIAFELGYNDAAAFSKAFKQATHQSPSQFLQERGLN